MSKKPNDSFGAHLLRRWRDSLEISQNEAAIKLEMEPSQLSRFERGSGKPGRSIAAKIDEVTGGMVPFASWDMPPPAGNSASDNGNGKAA